MSVEFLKAVAIRAIRTFCQTALATIGTTALISEVQWKTVISASALSALLSVLTSFATGLPEVSKTKGENDDADAGEVTEEADDATE